MTWTCIQSWKALNTSFLRAVGNLLHPLITRHLPQEPKIAEIATGTGAFLVDLVKEFPTATFDGYDISSASYPPAEQLPRKVTLHVTDAKGPAAPELHGKYDIVCIRFMNIALMPPDDWISVAKHAVQLLKPGGALQWIEGNFIQAMTILQSDPETKTSAMTHVMKTAISSMPHLDWFVTNLAQVLKDVGFAEVVPNVMSSDRMVEDRREMSHIASGAGHGILRMMSKIGVEGAPSEAEIDSLVHEMREEIDGGAYLRVDLWQFVAFKA